MTHRRPLSPGWTSGLLAAVVGVAGPLLRSQLGSGDESSPVRPVPAHLSLGELWISSNLALLLLGPAVPFLCGRLACSSSPLPHLPPPGSTHLVNRGTPQAELEPLGGYSWTLACLMVPSLSESSEEPGTRAIICLMLHNAVVPEEG